MLCLLLCLLFTCTSYAGWNGLTVATDGAGIPVYSSSRGGKKIGLLYNGYCDSLSLVDENGLYSCWLNDDLTVWLDQDKAMKNYPRNSLGGFDDQAFGNGHICLQSLLLTIRHHRPATAAI